MKIIIPLALALMVSGCAVFDKATERDPVREVIAGCNTITGALNILSPNIDRLTDQQVTTVTRVRDMSRPICTKENPPETAEALITDLATQIITVQTAISEDS